MKHLLIVLCLAELLISSCGPAAPGPCDADPVNAAGKQLGALSSRWRDAYKLASSSSRIALASPIQNLQEIKRETQALEVPQCLTKARGYLVDSMNAAIDGFLSFMAQEADAVIHDKFTSADQSLAQYTSEVQRIQACVPNCP